MGDTPLARAPSPPPWEAVVLFSRRLDPSSLAVAACVCRSWRAAMSSDELWRSICLSLSPSLSRHRGRPSYRHLFALLRVAAEQRRRRPPPPEISLGELLFAVEVLRGGEPVFSAVVPGGDLGGVGSQVFRFDVAGGGGEAVAVAEATALRCSWTVVQRGWKGAAVMMEGGEKGVAVGEDEVWFSEELPPPACCCSGLRTGGLVAELGLRLGDRSGGDMVAEGRRRAVVGVTVGVLRVVGWRYVEVDDGLMYLQHFISPP
ncbi:unnamed protein product [Spirodela intermedia]|uniref:F-box protein n=1 Tax=Spirodela intermedia TaxID=51605 RepID=A0A7I8JWY6_SPIIN|nr:unnamed protein product [Spirodela intermedia]